MYTLGLPLKVGAGPRVCVFHVHMYAQCSDITLQREGNPYDDLSAPLNPVKWWGELVWMGEKFWPI